jgi:hypothetical protein
MVKDFRGYVNMVPSIAVGDFTVATNWMKSTSSIWYSKLCNVWGLMAVNIYGVDLWIMTPYSLLDEYWCFRGMHWKQMEHISLIHRYPPTTLGSVNPEERNTKNQTHVWVTCNTLTTSAFAAPVTANTQYSALLTTGKVSVILDGGGLGALVTGATHTEVSSQIRCPGKREHVCPSGPTPSSRRWNRGSESGGK